MKEAMRGNRSVVAVRRDGSRKLKWRTDRFCAICTRRVWLNPVNLVEPEGVPEPRLTWVLCKECYQAVLDEVQRSPVQTPLRLRVAMGIVASERWPLAYSTRVRAYMSDRRWIIFIASGFIVAMIVHLMLIVMVAGMK